MATSTSRHWNRNNIVRLLGAIIPLASEARPLQRGALSLQLYKLAKTNTFELPSEHNDQKARIDMFFASQFGAPPHLDTAVDLMNQFIDGNLKVQEQQHPELFIDLLMLRSRLLRHKSMVPEARRDAERALALAKTVSAPQLALVVADLGTLDVLSKNYTKAESLYQEALQKCESTALTSKKQILLALAHAYILDKKFVQAEDVLNQCLDLEKVEHHSVSLHQTHASFVDLYTASGQPENAAPWKELFKETWEVLYHPAAFPK